MPAIKAAGFTVELRGPFTQEGDHWATSERYKKTLARSLKSNEKAVSMGDLCALVDFSAISSSGWKHLAFIERSLSDHWEVDEIIECSLSVP